MKTEKYSLKDFQNKKCFDTWKEAQKSKALYEAAPELLKAAKAVLEAYGKTCLPQPNPISELRGVIFKIEGNQ